MGRLLGSGDDYMCIWGSVLGVSVEPWELVSSLSFHLAFIRVRGMCDYSYQSYTMEKHIYEHMMNALMEQSPGSIRGSCLK